MIILESQYDESHPRVRIEMHSDSSLDEVLEAFEGFLRATGYGFDGNVVIETEFNHEESRN